MPKRPKISISKSGIACSVRPTPRNPRKKLQRSTDGTPLAGGDGDDEPSDYNDDDDDEFESGSFAAPGGENINASLFHSPVFYDSNYSW